MNFSAIPGVNFFVCELIGYKYIHELSNLLHFLICKGITFFQLMKTIKFKSVNMCGARIATHYR